MKSRLKLQLRPNVFVGAALLLISAVLIHSDYLSLAGVRSVLDAAARPSPVAIALSILLWLVALESTVSRFQAYRKRPGTLARESSTRRPFRIWLTILLLATILFVSWLCTSPTTCKTAWRYLRFKIYGDFFQTPILLLIQDGKFSPKLLVVPLIVLSILAIAIWFRKKSSGPAPVILLMTALASCAPASAQVAETDTSDMNGANRLILVQAPSLVDDVDPFNVSHIPSEKNKDDGYNAHQLMLKRFAVMKFVYDGGRYQNEEIFFRMAFPQNVVPGQKYPLVLWMHGYGESTGENMRQLAHLHHAAPLFFGKNAPDFYMLAPQLPPDNPYWLESISSRGSGDSGIAILNALMERALEEFPIDPERVSVMGISSGASAAWTFVAQSKRPIAALAVFSGAPSSKLSPEQFVNVHIWTFNNNADGDSGQKTREFVDAINRVGGDAHATVMENESHDAWSEPLTQGNVLLWVLDPYPLDDEAIRTPLTPRSWINLFLLYLLPTFIIIRNIATKVKMGRSS